MERVVMLSAEADPWPMELQAAATSQAALTGAAEAQQYATHHIAHRIPIPSHIPILIPHPQSYTMPCRGDHRWLTRQCIWG